MAGDVRAWLTAYDEDGDGLPERDRPRVTGYDLDILSYWYFNGTRLGPARRPAGLERVDFASFVYRQRRGRGGAGRRDAGDAALADEFDGRAERIRAATWPISGTTRRSSSIRSAPATTRAIPIRELHGFFPFTTLLAPDEPRYTAALAQVGRPAGVLGALPAGDHQPVSLPALDLGDGRPDAATSRRTRSAWARARCCRRSSTTIRPAITPAHFMELMARYNDLVYPGVNPCDPLWRPNVHEYYSKWEPHSQSPRPKPSDISHDFHSMYCSLVVEGRRRPDAARRRADRAAADGAGVDVFPARRLRYRGHDLTIVWDGRTARCATAVIRKASRSTSTASSPSPAPTLGHVIYDPNTRRVESLDG